jgi:hypothetical protein
MSEKLIQAGSSVESHCRKCKTVTDHHVVIMDGEIIAKVECKVCKGRHAYKTPAEPKVKALAVPRPKKEASTGQPSAARQAAAATRQTAAANKQAQVLADQWEKLVAPCAKPATYSMERAFRTGDVIDHPAFGLGYVQKLMKPSTMEVRFKDAVRNMRCAVIG